MIGPDSSCYISAVRNKDGGEYSNDGIVLAVTLGKERDIYLACHDG